MIYFFFYVYALVSFFSLSGCEKKQSDDFFMACIAGWTGIVDADGKELEFTEENKRLIFLEMSENKKLSEKFFSCFGGISGGFRHI